jgi:hypothetical protein
MNLRGLNLAPDIAMRNWLPLSDEKRCCGVIIFKSQIDDRLESAGGVGEGSEDRNQPSDFACKSSGTTKLIFAA